MSALPVHETKKETAEVVDLNVSFSSGHWLSYFEDNKKARISIAFPNDVKVPIALRIPLIRSLQRFQIGETGEGKHLKKCAKVMNDPKYEQCIDLFIKEEQYHARVLAQMIQAMDGTLLTWHWTDIAFIGLRRMLKLKTEIFVLLIAEIVGKCFYRACAKQLEYTFLSDAFSLIVLDEIGHLEFHCAFLREQLKGVGERWKRLIYYCWSVLFFAACMVFVADNARTLRALNMPPRAFLADCSTSFQRAASRTLGV